MSCDVHLRLKKVRGSIFIFVLAGASAATLLVACFDFGGLESEASDSGVADDATSSGDVGTTTACPAGCMPLAPDGWTGPSAVYAGPPASKPTACPKSYGQFEAEAIQGVTADPATCECGAATFQGATCQARVESWSGSGCSGLATLEGAITVPGDHGCLTTADTGYLKMTAPTLDAGSCSFPSAKTNVPDASIAEEDIACGLLPSTACTGAASCVTAPAPDAPFTKLCIHRDGDVACPNSDYPAKVVAFRGTNDSRSCSPCVGKVSAGSCGTAWGTSAGIVQCAATPPNTYTTESCAAGGPYAAGTVVGGAIGPTGLECAPTGGAPQGAATPANPITFCCK